MQGHTYWNKWARFLQRWKMQEFIATLLEASGPLRVLAAQGVYLSQPFLGRSMSGGEWDALALLLEDEQESRLFIQYLREE